jgi:large subunit ribosomal protein L15
MGTKANKHRGRNRYHGRGKKAGRGAGKRGGRGNAGMNKHRVMTQIIGVCTDLIVILH